MGNWIVKNLKYLADCALEVFSGEDSCCILCGEYLAEKGETKEKCREHKFNEIYGDVDGRKDGDNLYLCENCMSSIKLCKDSINMGNADRSFKCCSAAYYSGGMKELILRLKYKSDFTSGNCIAYFMKEVIAREKLSFDIIACVPSGQSSYKKRGYNQSHVLAVKLGKLMEAPVSNPLIKIRETKDQIGLDEASRWNNMNGSFKVRGTHPISLLSAAGLLSGTAITGSAVYNKKILLVDDVITTGATAFFCACALSDAGAEKVTILTAAKSRL